MPLGHTMVLRFILARLHPRLGTVRTCLKRIAPTCGGAAATMTTPRRRRARAPRVRARRGDCARSHQLVVLHDVAQVRARHRLAVVRFIREETWRAAPRHTAPGVREWQPRSGAARVLGVGAANGAYKTPSSQSNISAKLAVRRRIPAEHVSPNGSPWAWAFVHGALCAAVVRAARGVPMSEKAFSL